MKQARPPEPTYTNEPEYFERHVARLLIILYCCGEVVTDLLDGETRQIESRTRLHFYDFWVREPGHLALALLDARRNGLIPDSARPAIDRMLATNQADTRRVATAGYRLNGELDSYLSFLTARALISDRPSFARTGAHKIILEPQGVKFVSKLLEECPTAGWYREQCEVVKTYAGALGKVDMATMPYLDFSPAIAATEPLIPYIRERYARVFVGQQQ
jgi:hypothetical protein